MMVIIAVILIFFGAKKIPELAKGLGTGIKEFKKATREVNDELQQAIHEEPPPARKLPPANTQASPDSHWTEKYRENEQPGNAPSAKISSPAPKP